MSDRHGSVGSMFECVFDIDPGAGESALRAQVELFEQVKSKAAAAQARATALWESRRRAAETALAQPDSPQESTP